MNRENKLNGKYFINFRRFETVTDTQETVEARGRVVEEVADGWFYVEIFGTGYNVIEKKVMSVADFASAQIYDGVYEYRDALPLEIKRIFKNENNF